MALTQPGPFLTQQGQGPHSFLPPERHTRDGRTKRKGAMKAATEPAGLLMRIFLLCLFSETLTHLLHKDNLLEIEDAYV